MRRTTGESLLSRYSADSDQVTLEVALQNGWITSHLDGNHGSLYPRAEEFVSAGVPYVSANCIVDDQIDLSRAKYLTSERAATIKKGVARSGDVIFAHNATVGPVAILRTEEPKVILSTSVTYYRCNPIRVNPEYLKHFMRSRRFVSQYEAVMRQSTRNQVPITTQRRFVFTFPPIDSQASIAATMEAIETEVGMITDLASRRLNALAELKQSLLVRAFSGELTREPIAA
jgi:type I restriction enzyme S subunit